MIKENSIAIQLIIVCVMAVSFLYFVACFIAVWRDRRKYKRLDAYERLEIIEMEESFDDSERTRTQSWQSGSR